MVKNNNYIDSLGERRNEKLNISSDNWLILALSVPFPLCPQCTNVFSVLYLNPFM